MLIVFLGGIVLGAILMTFIDYLIVTNFYVERNKP